jgi:hypothetical protein
MGEQPGLLFVRTTLGLEAGWLQTMSRPNGPGRSLRGRSTSTWVTWRNGQQITEFDIGYDQGPDTGGHRCFVDDIRITQ